MFYQYSYFSLGLLNVVVAQDQNPPYGMDKGVWVLKDVKPDFETQEDTDAYYNNKVDVSETWIGQKRICSPELDAQVLDLAFISKYNVRTNSNHSVYPPIRI